MKTDTATPAPVTEAYAVPSLPGHWVVRQHGHLFLVPAVAKGWLSRKPYKGHDPAKAGLEPVKPYMLFGTMIPTDETAAKVTADGKAIFG